MQTNRTDYEAGFATLGLSPQPGANYRGAHEHAKQFKKCTVLTHCNVSYSSSSNADSGVKASQK